MIFCVHILPALLGGKQKYNWEAFSSRLFRWQGKSWESGESGSFALRRGW